MRLTPAQPGEGKPATNSEMGGKAKIDNANVVTTGIECSNGVIHAIGYCEPPPN